MSVHWMKDDELAEHLGISRAMVRKMLGKGMPSLTIGRSRRYDPAAVVAWLALRQDAA